MKLTFFDYIGISSILVFTFLGCMQIFAAALNGGNILIEYNSFGELWVEVGVAIYTLGYLAIKGGVFLANRGIKK